MVKLHEFIQSARQMANETAISFAEAMGLPANSQTARASRMVYLISQDEELALRFLRSHPFDVNQQVGALKTTPLIAAAQTGSAALTQALLEAGAKSDIKDRDGMTAHSHAQAISTIYWGSPKFDAVCALIEQTEKSRQILKAGATAAVAVSGNAQNDMPVASETGIMHGGLEKPITVYSKPLQLRRQPSV